MRNWNEIQTAAEVARSGTITAAAEALGLHRATVTRHIDQLEAQLGAKLFQRHARGFTATELGLELLRVADATEAQFGELTRIANRQSQALTGPLKVTAVDALAGVVLPIIADFQAAHPAVPCEFFSSDRIYKLEYGEADVAFRVGSKPQAPDNVVIPLRSLEMGLYVSRDYVARYGEPKLDDPFHGQKMVGPNAATPSAPFVNWIRTHFAPDRLSFTSNSIEALWGAVVKGVGIGFLPKIQGDQSTELLELPTHLPDLSEPIWIVTHVDLHRTAKIQEFVKIAKRSG
ncbi:MAG: LysR family transcriptional regulator [Pseudomonadota bacterium]